MTEETTTPQVDDDEVCPHCGAVLDLAQAMQNERSVLRPKVARVNVSQTQDAAARGATRADDQSFV